MNLILSHSLIITQVYYEAKAAKLRDQKDSTRAGVHNDGYDDMNYDYILGAQTDEIMNDRYILKHRMGKVWDLMTITTSSVLQSIHYGGISSFYT